MVFKIILLTKRKFEVPTRHPPTDQFGHLLNSSSEFACHLLHDFRL